MPELITPPADATDSADDMIASLLMGEEVEEKPVAAPEMDAATDQADEPEKAEEVSAEEPEKDELDYGMKVPITGGEPVTLGELKDAWQNKQAALQEIQDRENTVLRKSQDIEQLLSFVEQLPAGALETAQQRRQQMYQAEMQKLTTAIPALATAEGAREVVATLAEVAKDYGISEAELKMVMDSRYIKWMYDAARQAKAVREARSNVKPLRAEQPKAQSTSKTSEIDVLMAKAKSGGESDQLAAISALISKRA